MAIRYKLGLIVGGLSLIILFMFAVTWMTASAQKDDSLVINLAGRQRMLSQKMTKETFLFSSLEDLNERKAYIKDAKNTIKVFDITLKALCYSGDAPLELNLEKTAYSRCPVTKEPAGAQLKVVEELWKPFLNHMNLILADQDGSGLSLQYILNNNLELMGAMDKAVAMMQEMSEKKGQRLIFLQSLCLVGGVVLMLLSLFQIQGIARQLLSSSASAKELSQGDLTLRFLSRNVPVNKMNEIVYLGYNLNSFIEVLQNHMKNIQEESVILSESSVRMNNVAGDLANESKHSATRIASVAGNAEKMSEEMNAVAAAMEQLTANTRQIADSTSRMSETILAISANTEKANQISERAVKRVETASSRVDDLGDAALKIGRVSESITDISEQTNLLALNATIEAARAGEAGRGFAVVAGEIKNLATQTALATGDIKKNIEWIQGAAGSTVEDIREIKEIINEVNAIVQTISSAVVEQADTVSEIDINVSQGAEAIQEVTSNAASTSSASGEVYRDINEVSQSISLVSTNSRDIDLDSEKLLQLAEKLNKMVAHFKIA